MHDVGNTKYPAPKLSFVNILLNFNNLFFTSSILRLAVKKCFYNQNSKNLLLFSPNASLIDKYVGLESSILILLKVYQTFSNIKKNKNCTLSQSLHMLPYTLNHSFFYSLFTTEKERRGPN